VARYEDGIWVRREIAIEFKLALSQASNKTFVLGAVLLFLLAAGVVNWG